MSKVFRNTAFKFGFGIGFCLLAFANYLVYAISYNEFIKDKFINGVPVRFSAGGYYAGFPFGFYQVIIGNPNSTYFSLIGLILNVLVALIISFAVGCTFKFIWSKLASSRLHLK